MAVAHTSTGRSDRAAGVASVWVLASLVTAVFVAGVLLRPAIPIDETRYLSVAWEMHLSGDYFVPTRNGDVYAHKPPLLFWLINAVWAVTGVSELAARLVGPFFAVLNLPLTFLLARRLFPERPEIAPAAATVLASLMVYGLYTGLTMFDAILTTMTLVFLLGAWSALVEDRRLGWWLCGLALGFGVLAKGPVILVHTLPVIIGSQLWRPRDIGTSAVMKGGLGALALGLAVVAVWLLPAVLLGSDAYREDLLWNQTAGRVANPFDHGRPFWFFLALVPVYLFPWSFHLDFWGSLRRLEVTRPAIRFLLLQSAAALLAFTVIASKQAHYLVPELPVISILIASVLAGQRLRAWAGIGAIAVTLGALLLGLVLLLAPGSLSGDWVPGNTALGAAILIGFALVAILLIRLPSVFGTALWTLSLLATLNLWIGASPLGEAFSMASFARHFDGRDGDQIAWYGRPYNAEFNFIGRLSLPLHEASSRADLDAWAAGHPQGLVIAPLSALSDLPPPQTVETYGDRPYGLWNAAALSD